jgi:hypothetical protein
MSLNKNCGIVKAVEKKIAVPAIARNRGHLIEVKEINQYF